MSRRPNFLFIMSDDHASHAISAYGSRINETPHLDRIAAGGMRFDRCFCTNSICTPSRAAILTGTYNHVNGVTTLDTHMDNRLTTFPKLLREAGYQTAMIGKWHLGHGPRHDPTGFDLWRVLPGQGHYHNPVFLGQGAADAPPGVVEIIERSGYVTDLITDDCLDWLDRRDPNRPFALLCHHKAPHRHWEPSRDHATLYADVDIAEPETMFDDHTSRSAVVQAMKMRLLDLDPILDLKAPVPDGLTEDEEIRWRYQRYIKDYLRTIASIDDNLGRVLDWLDETGLSENTVVVYSSDQGFYLGEHGWYDKRWMYEESLRTPLIVRWPGVTGPGSTSRAIVSNVDFAPTFLDVAGVQVPSHMQGRSLAPLLAGDRPEDWRTSFYYHYYEADGPHAVAEHYGVATDRYKLIRYPATDEWELFDLETDPREMRSVADDPAHSAVREELETELRELRWGLAVPPEDTAWTSGSD